jgi:hypothetical protein
MRASPWRSLVRLPPLAVLVVAACSANVDLSNCPPPCAPEDYLCPATGRCVPKADLSVSADGGRDAESLTAASTVDNCLVGYTVRQSGYVDLPVPFVSDVGTVTTTTLSPDLTAMPMSDADGSVVVRVLAGHGATLGQATVHLAESSFGGASDRDVTIFISPIMAASTKAGGKTTNPGTTDEPFLTFQQAAAAAYPGDTIILKSLAPFGQDALGNDVSQAEQNFATAPAAELKNNVTVASLSITARSALHMPILLDGDAILDDLDIEDTRLVITKPGSTVQLQGGTIVGSGITIDALAGTGPADTATTLHVLNAGPAGEIRNDPTKPTKMTPSEQLDSLLIAADRANVIIENGGAVRSVVANLAAIHSVGVSTTVTIHDKTMIQNEIGGPALNLEKLRTLDVDNVTFDGVAQISDATSDASFTNSTFEITGLPPALAANTSEISFAGLSLSVSNSTFTGQAVAQNNTMSRVTLRNSKILGYTEAGYRLIAGFLDAGTMADPGGNTFTDFFYANNSRSLGSQPAAFSVEVQDPPSDGVVATSSASTFNDTQPGTCSASQTEKMSMDTPGVVTMDMPGIVAITTPACPIVVNFY